jgi:hypothetical protein
MVSGIARIDSGTAARIASATSADIRKRRTGSS